MWLSEQFGQKESDVTPGFKVSGTKRWSSQTETVSPPISNRIDIQEEIWVEVEVAGKKKKNA